MQCTAAGRVWYNHDREQVNLTVCYKANELIWGATARRTVRLIRRTQATGPRRDSGGTHANHLPSLNWGVKDRGVQVPLDGSGVLRDLSDRNPRPQH